VFEIDSGPRARIGEISLEGAPLEPRARVLSRLDLEPGQPYDRVELQSRLSDYVAQLRHRGYYQASASQRPRLRENGSIADLTVEIQPGPLVNVQFAGDPLPRGKREDLVPVEREGSVDEDLLEDSSRRIVEALHQQGYWKAQATHERRETDGRLTILFTVHRGAQYRVQEGGVEISGAEAVPMEELRPLVRLSAGDLFVASALDATVAAIERLYRSRGFAQVKVESSASEGAPGEVVPRISVTEGPRTLVGALTIEGNQAVPTSQLLTAVRTKTGDPYYGPAIAADRDALILEYLNRGFESADVTVRPELSQDGTRADVHFQVFEGAQTIVDHILIVGNSRTDPAVIQNELLIAPGQPLGLADVVESQRRLSSLGLFRRVRITELPQTGSARRDVLVTVEEALRTTIGYGGGLEIDKISRATGPSGEAREKMELAPRGFFEIGRRNLGGRNRSVTLYTRVGLRPDAVPDDPARTASNFGFVEYRVVGTYREPQTKRLKGDLTVTAAVEQGVRTSFNYARKGMNAELSRRLGAGLRVSGRYSFGTTRTFDEQLDPEDQVTIDRLFPQVRLSAFSAALLRDTRDDVLEPQGGTLLSVDGVVAARAMGSQVGFDKLFLQGFWYRRLGPHPIVFATGARLGVATGFPREAQPTDANGNPIPGEPVVLRDVPASERFFAGGDTTIRGYALDSVGAPDTIGALGFPKGGNALIVLNAELRVPVWRSLGAAFFVDGGNVFARASDLDLGELRGGVGFGIRYKSPLGPIRVDLGFKMDRRTIAGELEPRTALHFSIGQAF
jgi:outer membrane protein insertion porin family